VVTGNIIAGTVVLIGLALALITSLILSWIKKRADQTESKLDDIIVLAIGRPLVITIIVVSIYFALNYYAEIPEQYQWILDSKYIDSVYIVIGAWIVSNFVHNFIKVYGTWFASRTDTEIDARLITLLELIAKYLIWFIAFLLILYTLQIDITPFLAAAGIVGLAIALAAQDILSNFFGGAIITLDKPFKVGDRIQIDTQIGDVVNIGPRSTRIMTLDNQLVTIPNNKITTSVITNFAMPDARLKIRIPIGVAYGTDVERVKKILLEIADEIGTVSNLVLHDPSPEAFFLEFGESSLNFQMIVWTHDFSKIFDVKDMVNTRIVKRFEAEGIEIPFRQVDIHMRSRIDL
jgi:MscS family membrane protein